MPMTEEPVEEGQPMKPNLIGAPYRTDSVVCRKLRRGESLSKTVALGSSGKWELLGCWNECASIPDVSLQATVDSMVPRA